MKKIIGIVMMLVGISLIITAAFMKYKVYENQKVMLNAFQNTIREADEQEEHKTNLSGSNKSQDAALGSTKAIGIITIPKIKLEAVIDEGVDLETLKYSVGHFPGTSLPEQHGNFCLAAHRSYTYGEFFNRLDELEIGDEIIVKTKSSQYKYKVSEKNVVEPTEVSVLNNTESSTITLVTCTPIRIATHRLIVKGTLE